MRLINRASTGTALKAMQCIVTMTNGLKGRESADALGIQVVKCETRIVRGMLPIQTIRLRKPNRHRKGGLGMERTKETLEARVRETPLVDRLKECQQRIGNMCAELRGPKMSIPVEYYDDDFYICTTLADAQATVEALQRERDEWRSNAVAQEVRANDLERDCKDLLSDIDGERSKVGNLLKKIAYWEKRHRTDRELAEETMNLKSDELSALQGLVRALPVVRIELNGAYHDTLLARPEDDAVKELLRYRATLDATTPATTKT